MTWEKEEQNFKFILGLPHYRQPKEVIYKFQGKHHNYSFGKGVHTTERLQTCQVSEFQVHKEVTDRETNLKKFANKCTESNNLVSIQINETQIHDNWQNNSHHFKIIHGICSFLFLEESS